MPKVRFTKDYNYQSKDDPRVTTAYKAGSKPQAVNQDCADRAVKAGVCELIEDSKKK